MTPASRNNLLHTAAVSTAVGLLVVTFLKLVWACDDSYIVFRSVEQFVAGHGPRWNPYERVQVFTSPAWYFVLVLFRAASSNVFLNVVTASAIATTLALASLRRLAGNAGTWLTAVAVLLGSNAFFDYTSSGLENPLCYAALALWLIALKRVAEAHRGSRAEVLTAGRWLLSLSAWVLLCRLDLVTLIAIPTIVAFERIRADIPGRQWVVASLPGLLPFIAWQMFALVYYGTPFPNPAYAKLATGIPHAALWQHGLWYLAENARRDPESTVVITAAIVLLGRSRRGILRAVGAGIAIHVVYVVAVGGDFMLGRFLASAMFVSAAGLVWYAHSLSTRSAWRVLAPIGGAAMVYAFAFVHTPANSPVGWTALPPHPHGVADERGVYARASLWAYVHRGGARTFPDIRWAREGLALRESGGCCAVRWSVGYFGYYAGIDKRIIDLFALCDPLLARLPANVSGQWRVGHYVRRVPRGYVESVWNGNRNVIADPDYRAFDNRVRLLTQSKTLFSRRRFAQITSMLTGR